MTCHPQRQIDEWFCAPCGLRWAVDEPKPACQKAEEPKRGDPRLLRIAKCIIGPRLDVAIGREKMLELRDHKWDKMASRAEREDAVNAAHAILRELDIS